MSNWNEFSCWDSFIFNMKILFKYTSIHCVYRISLYFLYIVFMDFHILSSRNFAVEIPGSENETVTSIRVLKKNRTENLRIIGQMEKSFRRELTGKRIFFFKFDGLWKGKKICKRALKWWIDYKKIKKGMSLNSKMLVQNEIARTWFELERFFFKNLANICKVSTQNVIFFIREIFSVFQLSKAGFFMLYWQVGRVQKDIGKRFWRFWNWVASLCFWLLDNQGVCELG